MTIRVNQSDLDTVAVLAKNALLFMGGILFENIDKIKSVSETFAQEDRGYEDSIEAGKVNCTSSLKALNKLMNELVLEKFGHNIPRRRADVQEFFERWQFIFSLPSMRKIVPLLTNDPLKKLRVLFPTPTDIRKFIIKDLHEHYLPSRIKHLDTSPEYINGLNAYRTPCQAMQFLPDINLLE